MRLRLPNRCATIRATALLAIASVWLCLLAVLLTPHVAFAVSYDVGPVAVDATLTADGSLEVTESRTYVFSGDYNGIFWDVPRGTYEGRDIDTALTAVSARAGGELVTFSPGSDGAPGTYEVTEMPDCLHLKIYSPGSGGSVTFQVGYVMPHLASRWADAGELYWQYVVADPSSNVEWKDVTAVVHLPVPGGEPVKAGENVRAWGHGPLDGEVGFRGNDVVFHSPGVGAAEFLEARITLPPSWLGEVPASQEPRLEAILAEEEAWAKNANAQRFRARAIAFGFPGFMVLAAIGSVVAAHLMKNRRLARIPEPQFTDKYYREIPTEDHPAILGMLYRDGRVDDKDFSATLMRLADEGRVSLDAVWTEQKGKRGNVKRVRDWRLLLFRDAGGRTDDPAGDAGMRIDDEAFGFLDEVIADRHKHVVDPNLLGPKGEPYVLASFFKETASSWPKAYESGYNRWTDELRAAYKARGFEKELGDSLPVGELGLAAIVLAVILGIVGIFLGVPNGLLAVAFVLLFGSGIYVLLSDEDEPLVTYTQEAVDIRAKLEALKRWLTDFTRLEEAIPADVVLWNKLLVMATELGISDKVAKQLKAHVPELAANPALTSYAWCSGSLEDNLDSPVRTMARSVGAGKETSSDKLYHDVSTYDLATSHDSSPSGGGGGFSSGGGGGFSGGGRGGAF